MSKLRRAVNRDAGVTAVCPLGGGECLVREDVQGKMRAVPCGFYAGLHEDERGVFARCDCPDPKGC